MERVSLIHTHRGIKKYLGTISHIGGIAFCTIPHKASRKIYIGLVGPKEDFLEVLIHKYEPNITMEQAIVDAHNRILKSKPKTWADSYSAQALKKAEELGLCKEYISALEDDVRIQSQWK